MERQMEWNDGQPKSSIATHIHTLFKDFAVWVIVL